MNTINYKGYSARIDFDNHDEIFVSRIARITDIVGFAEDSGLIDFNPA